MHDAAEVDGGRARSLLARALPVVLLALAAVAISAAVHRGIFPAYSWNRDEPVYLWQVQALREGKIFTTGGGTPLFFQPWLSGISDGMFFSQYTLGWPLVLLAGDVLLGSAAAALAFGAALAVVGTYALARELTRDRNLALVAGAVTLVSPLLVVQSGVYLGYLFSLGLGTLFGAALVKGLRTSSRWLLIASGALVGWLFMTRPFDGFLWAVALGGYALFSNRRELPRFVRAVMWVAIGFLPLFVATLAYNKHVTGSFTEFPITAADPRDTFGYGLRSIGRRWTPTNFTPLMGVKGVGRNGWELPPFVFGGYLSIAVVAAGLWLRRRDRSTLALVAIALVFPLGYVFFWGISLSAGFASVSGPIYFIPLLAPVSILAAGALTAAWRARPALAVGTAVLLALATVPFMHDRLDDNRSVSEAQVPWRDAAGEIRGRALVFVERSGPYLLHLNPFSANTPDLDGRILYATDRGPANLGLIARHPRRSAYFERTNLTTEQTLTDFSLPVPTVTVTRARVVDGARITLKVRVTNTTGDPVVMASLGQGGFVEQRTLSESSSRGETLETEWVVAAPEVAARTPGAVRLDEAQGTITIAAGTGAMPRLKRREYDFRATDGEVEVLSPGRAYGLRERKGGLRPRRVDELDALTVQVSALP